MNRLILQFTAQLHVNGYATNSVQNQRLDIVKFQGWLAEQEKAHLGGLQSLGGDDVKAYQAFLALHLKQRSINRHLSSLRLFFGFLEEAGMLETNPLDTVVFSKTLPTLPEMLLPGEVTALLEAPRDSHYLGQRDRAILELLYSSGLKLHELIGLDVDSLHLELGFLTVGGKRERMVPVTERAAALLRRYLAEHRPGRLRNPEDTCLFPGRDGGRITRVGIWKMMQMNSTVKVILAL